MNHKILVIDPDVDYATMIEQAFPEAQIFVAEAENQALALLSTELPSVIVLALELSGSSGFSLCRKIRKHARWREIPLIMISSEASPETFEKHKLLKDHANEYLIKPFGSDEISEMIQPYLSMSRENTLKQLQSLPEETDGGPYGLIFSILALGIIVFILIRYVL